MLIRKRISLLLALTFVASLLAIIVTTLGGGQTTASPSSRIKVLRRKDQLHIKPTAAELESLRQNAQEEEQKERTLEDKIPKHVPIKIKIRAEKEKAFKDLNNPNWHRDFELEVTNTSGKPIYFLRLMFSLPEVISDSGNVVGTSLYYGRPEFVDFDTRPIPSDVPIQPGESYVFKLPDHIQRAWDAPRIRQKVGNPKRIEILFAQLSFADGTGFNGTDGKPFPFKREQSAGPCRDPISPLPSGAMESRMSFVASLRQNLFGKKTGSASAGYFSFGGSIFLKSADADPQSGLCCPGSQCYFKRDSFYNCACQVAFGTQSTGCSDPRGRCSILIHNDDVWCESGVACPQDVIGPCEEPPPPASPTPTISPTPTATPTPAPACPSPMPTPNCEPNETPVWNSYPNCYWTCSLSSPTPTPGGGSGGGGPGGGDPGGGSCTEYWWVLYDCSTDYGQVLPQDYFITTTYAAEKSARSATVDGCVEVGRWYAGCW